MAVQYSSLSHEWGCCLVTFNLSASLSKVALRLEIHTSEGLYTFSPFPIPYPYPLLLLLLSCKNKNSRPNLCRSTHNLQLLASTNLLKAVWITNIPLQSRNSEKKLIQLFSNRFTCPDVPFHRIQDISGWVSLFSGNGS